MSKLEVILNVLRDHNEDYDIDCDYHFGCSCQTNTHTKFFDTDAREEYQHHLAQVLYDMLEEAENDY